MAAAAVAPYLGAAPADVDDDDVPPAAMDDDDDRQTDYRHRPIMVSQGIHDQMVPLRSVQFTFLPLESIQSLSHGRDTCATLR